MRISVAVTGFEPPAAFRSLVTASRVDGLAGIWCAEHLGYADAVVNAARIARNTDQLEISLTGVTPYVRHPAVLATQIAGLCDLAPGRVRLAVATGMPALLARLGVSPTRPLTTMRDFVSTLRALLAGKSVTGDVAGWHLDRFQLPRPHEADIDLCAIGPRMVELAAQTGDGVSLSVGASRDYLSDTVRRVETHLAAHGRDRTGFRVSAMVAVSVDDDVDAAVDQARALFTGMMPPDLADTLLAGTLPPGDWTRLLAADAVPDDLLGEIALVGTPDELPGLLDRYAATGVDELVLCWLTPSADPAHVIERIGNTGVGR